MMGGSRWGVDADEDDEEEQQLRERRIRVQQLVEASEQQELNRNLQQQQQNQQQQNPWGNFITNSRAPAPKPEEVNALVLNLSIEQQANLAARDGVTLEVLVGSGNEDEDITMDPDLAEEWLALNDGQQSSEVDNGANSELNQVPVLNVFSTPTNRRRGPGVRVGSAGGWTLEVFPGDFVVHRKYGIGKFVQTTLRPKTKLTEAEKAAQSERRAAILKQKLRERSAKVGSVTPDEIQQIRSIFGTEADTDPVSNPQVTVLEIAYADGIVHVPVDRAYRISRYRSGDAKVAPKLSRVRGGDAWAKAKQKVEANTVELAQDVLALYATRETLTRAPFDPAKEELVQEFSQSFPFTPTPDQIQCFEDVETDMVWRSRPMDRLVCGDVGFGKTEVAVRAIFRCIVNGQQAALLAPTGVLAAQHYKTMVARMGPGTPYNVTVGLLRGGMATKSGRELRQQVQSGEVSLVVGTHALLSNNIVYNNLGLLVIDEEQRFGVKQKERLKLICNGVDVLTLSATPIPRTLQMSLSGIRDVRIITM
jgi:transcription-repair coupling factor (superfamily II helicase)